MVSVRAVTEQEYANETKIKYLAEILGGFLVPRCSMHAFVVPEPQRKCTLPGLYWGRTTGPALSFSGHGCETDIGCDSYSPFNAVGKLCPSPVINCD